MPEFRDGRVELWAEMTVCPSNLEQDDCKMQCKGGDRDVFFDK